MARVPRRLMKDPAKAGLSPAEEHLLGCVDGSLSEEELGFVTGKDPAEIAAMLERLAENGLVSFGGEGGADEESAAVQVPDSSDGIALSIEERRRIDEYVVLITTVDHYRLLDVPRDATKDEIKKAYYRLAPKFHPDKHYGKNLGEFKNKIETIFSALTKAHDTLRYAKRRASYDASLPPLKPGDRLRRRTSQPGTAPAGRSSSPGRPSQPVGRTPPVGSSEPARPSHPGSAPSRRSSAGPAPASDPGRRTTPSAATDPAAPSDAPRPSHGPQPSERPRASVNPRPSMRPRSRPVSEAEREALARKLAGRTSVRRMPRAKVSEVRQSVKDVEQLDKPKVRKSAAEVLRGRYDQVRDTAKNRRLEKYLDTARVAMDAGDYRTAAAAYEQAARLAPDDEWIRNKAKTAAEKALGQ